MTEPSQRRNNNNDGINTDRLNGDESNVIDDDSEDCNESGGTSSDAETRKLSELNIAIKEKKQVTQVRYFFFIVLLVSIAGALFIYFFMARLEQEQFEEKFADDAQKVLGSLGNTFDTALGAFDAIALFYISYAKGGNLTFPFVTIAEYGIHFLKTKPLTKALMTYYLPVVTIAQRRDWEKYAAKNNTLLDKWVNATLNLQENWEDFTGPRPQNYSYEWRDVIYNNDAIDEIPYDTPRGDGLLDIHLPEWGRFPLVGGFPSNWDWYRQLYTDGLTTALTKRKAALLEPIMIPRPGDPAALEEAQSWCKYYEPLLGPDETCLEPLSQWYYPVIDSTESVTVSEESDYPQSYPVKAIIATEFYWRGMFRDILPASSVGFLVTVYNDCLPQTFTYQIDGPRATYLGVDYVRSNKYKEMSIKIHMSKLNSLRVEETGYTGLPMDYSQCTFSFEAYPSELMEDQFKSSSGIIFAFSAVALIVFPFLVFLMYDRMVEKQRKKIMQNATRSDAIISSLFPAGVRDELYPLKDDDGNKTRGGGDSLVKESSAPIAKLYPETTVLFADIAEFTVWSSVRDAFQVFRLLETIYVAFDKIAKRRKVFKVETVGDSYIAVCGLPEPRSDHAVVMVKFAKDIIIEMKRQVLDLEVFLGPGTSNLAIRVGLNSGPTTAGVLRGAKGRFQLFGDTVNTAARMESNSKPSKIMCTEQTAKILIAAGKEHWVTARSDLVEAKGKGSMQCYWCDPVVYSASQAPSEEEAPHLKAKDDLLMDASSLKRLVDWMTVMFEELLTEVVSARHGENEEDDVRESAKVSSSKIGFGSPRDEVSEIICLSKETNNNARRIKLDSYVKAQLSEYISLIASMYQENPFHNFHHACHVVMAARKLLSRVVKADGVTVSATTTSNAYGITSDQLTQFAIVFSALIHDVDHPGVSNGQLVKEQTEVALKYDNKSVAEQNSITLAWELLNEERFDDLRYAIMPTDADRVHFRKLLVNSVLATDLFDKELKELRESRWSKAFYSALQGSNGSSSPSVETVSEEDSNRRATIVIEHVIQAADVSHTMQHWHIYQKWNRCLLREMYSAYLAGRAEKDPTIGWYDGELWFFDNYIIPLAKKLKTCGVFGVSCDELLDYANRNRAEWAAKGRGIVAEFVELIKTDSWGKSSMVETGKK